MAKGPAQEVQSRRVLLRRIGATAGVFVAVVTAGVVGYLVIGQGRWSFEDALYMSVITLSTVGYGELEGMSEVPGARAFTMLLILAGTGALLYLMSAMTAFVVEGDLRGAIRRRSMDRRIESLSDHYILCGMGATGGHIAQELAATGHPFVVIDHDIDKLERMQREHDLEPLHVIGDATEEKTLQAAGIGRAKGLVSALSDDRDNLFLTFTARAMSPHLRIVAKTVEPDNHAKIRRAGADDVISPTFIGGLRMVSSLVRPGVVGFLDHMVHDTADPHRIEDLPILEGCPQAGKALRDSGIRERFDASVMAVQRANGEHCYNPSSDFVLQPGMTLMVLVRSKTCPALRAAFQPTSTAPTR